MARDKMRGTANPCAPPSASLHALGVVGHSISLSHAPPNPSHHLQMQNGRWIHTGLALAPRLAYVHTSSDMQRGHASGWWLLVVGRDMRVFARARPPLTPQTRWPVHWRRTRYHSSP